MVNIRVYRYIVPQEIWLEHRQIRPSSKLPKGCQSESHDFIVSYDNSESTRTQVTVGINMKSPLLGGTPKLDYSHLTQMSTIKAKSGSYWGKNELSAFRIEIICEEPEQFFGGPLHQDLNISSVILDNVHRPSDATQADTEFFAHLGGAIPPAQGKKTFVIDFAAVLLNLMGYNDGHHIVHTRIKIPFEMCEKHVSTKTDVCITDETGDAYLLPMQEAKVSNAQLFLTCYTNSCNP